MTATSQVTKQSSRTLPSGGWRRAPLVDVDEEGIDIRNLSCTQIGLRELLHCEGVTDIAQAMAAPIGFKAEKRKQGYWRLRASLAPAWTSQGLKLNRGWRLVAHFTPAALAVPEILRRVKARHPVLVCSASLLLPYYPADKDPLHTAIAARIEGDELLVYDDMELPTLVNKATRVPLSHLKSIPQGQLVRWYHLEQVETTGSWGEELAPILATSVRWWRCGDTVAATGLPGLRAFLVWFRSWDIDLKDPGDIDRLTALFLSMRFEMSSYHHLLAVAIGRTPNIPSAGRAAEALTQVSMSWNAVILHLFASKQAKEMKRKGTVDAIIAGLIDQESKSMELLEACQRELSRGIAGTRLERGHNGRFVPSEADGEL